MARRKAVAAEAVTNENFGEILIEGLREAVEIHEGRREPAVKRSYLVTARAATVIPAEPVSAAEIRELRESLHLSQTVFAAALGVSAATDRAWEQNKRVPDGPSLRLLQICKRHPAVILEYVAQQRRARESRKRGPLGRRSARTTAG